MSKHYFLRLVGCSLLSFFLLSGGAANSATNVELTGVLTTDQGEPIPHAWVFVSYSEKEFQACRTDSAGEFEFDAPAGLKSPESRTPKVSTFVMGNPDSITQIDRINERKVLPAWEERRFVDSRAIESQNVKWIKDNGWILKVLVPEMATREIRLLHPDGRPLENQTVQLFPEARSGFGGLRLSTQTDEDGRLKIRQFPTHIRFAVRVPGVGFGSTGSLVFHQDETALVEVPRLAAYATVKVTAPGATNGKAWISGYGYGLSGFPVATMGADGKFTLRDLLPGTQSIRFTGDLKFDSLQVDVQAGAELERTLVKFKPLPPPPPVDAKTAAANAAARRSYYIGKDIGRVNSGTLVDPTGKPIANGAVYLQEKWHGGMRVVGECRATQTDENGRFSFPKSEEQKSSHSPWVTRLLIAKSAGYPPVVLGAGESRIVFPDSPDPLPEKKYQLQVAPVGGTLNVKVLSDGKPAEGFHVGLCLKSYHQKFGGMWARMRNSSKVGWKKIIHPTVVTNADGVASFIELLPGHYTVKAQQRGPEDYQYLGNCEMGFGGDQTPVGWMKQVSVTSGQTTDVSVAVRPYPRTLNLRVLEPDGEPVRGVRIEMNNYYATSQACDDDGVMQWKQRGVGLKTFSLKSGSNPAELPNYQVSSMVAASGLLPPRTVELRAGLRRAPTLEVQVLDLAGDPVEGAPVIGDGPGRPSGRVFSPRFSGTTDSQGKIKWQGLSAQEVTLVSGPFSSNHLDAPDEELVKQTFFPSMVVEPNANEDVKVELREKLAGWVRAKVVLPKGIPVSKLKAHTIGDAPVKFDSQSGDYVLGPIFESQVTPSFSYPNQTEHVIYNATEPIEITPGKVTKTKIELKRRFSPAQNWGGLTGVVTESDGETPSYRARIFLFVPGAEQKNSRGFAAMAGSGISDADGKFEISVWHQGSTNLDALLGSSSLEPILVAHFPGRTGGVSIPLPEKDVPISIKLPAPISRTGVVTVNGQPTDDLPALVRVMARPVDGGPVADLLAVETSVNADGSFTLAGLSLGKHEVQASIDNVWFSVPVDVDIGSGADADHFDIDVPELGLPVRLKLTDSAGVALEGLKVEVPSLRGPLVNHFRKEAVVSDGGGFVHLDGLPAGKVELRVGSMEKSLYVQVPAWSKDPKPLEVQVLEVQQ